MKPECLAVIPAHGAAQGVPYAGDVGGAPLLGHAIHAARAAARVTRVLVSTDDPALARLAGRDGVEHVTASLPAGDASSAAERATMQALAWLRTREGYAPELVLFVDARAPLVGASDLDAMVDALDAERADSAFLGVPFAGSLWRQGSGQLADAAHAAEGAVYRELGSCSVARTAQFLETGRRLSGRVAIQPIAAERGITVERAADLALAEAAFRQRDARSLAERLPQPPSALVMDFDGVLTDDGVTLNQDGVESVRCDRGDGLGLGLVKQAGLRLLILSKERNPVVSARARKLQIECLQGVDDKLTRLEAWAAENAVDLDRAVYIGNDVNDLACMRRVGCAAAPRDAHADALRAARIVLTEDGGRGAVRELCDLILPTL